jgi:hypothetical protein
MKVTALDELMGEYPAMLTDNKVTGRTGLPGFFGPFILGEWR